MDGDRPLNPPFDYVLKKGDVVGGYEIEERLGSGGWGTVYRARRLTNREPLAIKAIRPEYAGDPEYRRLFEREQTGLKAVRNAHLGAAFDWSVEPDGLLWLAMPWIEGVTLSELVGEEGPLPPRQAAELIAQAADGLRAVHDAGLVHRDLHPGNLMIEAEDRVVVVDFGLAKRFDHTSGSPFLSRPGAWSSPEAAQGEQLTPHSDLYTLGLVLAFAVTGSRPVEGRLVLPANIEIPSGLRSAIEKATAPDPAQRFESSRAFADELRRFAASSGSPTPRTTRRPMSLLLSAAGLGIVMLTALAVLLGSSLDGGDQGHDPSPSATGSDSDPSSPDASAGSTDSEPSSPTGPNSPDRQGAAQPTPVSNPALPPSPKVRIAVEQWCSCNFYDREWQVKVRPRITNQTDRSLPIQVGESSPLVLRVAGLKRIGDWPSPLAEPFRRFGKTLLISPNPNDVTSGDEEPLSEGYVNFPVATHWPYEEIGPHETLFLDGEREGVIVFNVPRNISQAPSVELCYKLPGGAPHCPPSGFAGAWKNRTQGVF